MTSAAAPLLDHLLAPLRGWLTEPRVTDIALNQPGAAWIREHGKWHQESVALDVAVLEDIAVLAGALRRQDVGTEDPLLSTELPDGTRLQVCLPPSVPTGSVSFSFRRHSPDVAPLARIPDRYRTEGWHRWDAKRAARSAANLLPSFESGEIESFLLDAVRARLNILVAGATGAGKTTLSNSMIAAIDPNERLVTIEDAAELAGLPPNHVRLLYARGGSGPDYERLLEASLRMRPDRVFLQEIRGAEAATYVLQICSGHPGSITTIHGATAAEAFQRLFALAAKGAALEENTLTSLLAAAIDVIVPLHEAGGTHHFGSVWFVADAASRGETAAELLRL